MAGLSGYGNIISPFQILSVVPGQILSLAKVRIIPDCVGVPTLRRQNSELTFSPLNVFKSCFIRCDLRTSLAQSTQRLESVSNCSIVNSRERQFVTKKYIICFN